MIDAAGVRGRLAPSPTGVLHLGNARSFLFAWLDARARGGEILLRIEDLDGPRVRAGAEERTIEDLRWLGLDWDGRPERQSARSELHATALRRLQEEGFVYACSCTRRDVAKAASAPHAGEEGPVYPGTCRGRWRDAGHARAATGRAPCWRFRVPEGVVRFEDRVHGAVSYDAARALGDFVVWKRDGQAAYQLAVVADDADQGVTDVLRGDDLLPSTARQLLLYEVLGAPPPRWAHVPLVTGGDGRRLAKRHGDTSLRAFRARGVPAEEIVGWLAAHSGLRPGAEACAPRELIADFALERIPRAPLVWSGGCGPA